VKISVVADCHLNRALYKGVLDKKYPTLPFRTVDFMKAFYFIITQNIEKIKPDLMVIAGDVYDTYDPSNEVRAFFNRQLKRLSDANIPVIILVGNHDICRKHHALSPLKTLELDGCTVVEEPMLTTVGDKVLMLFPYSLKVERGEKEIREQFHEFVEESKKVIEEEHQDKQKMFFGHFGVKGAVLKSYSSKDSNKQKSLINRGGDDISLADLDTLEAEYIFLGDYHQHQILPINNGVAMYTGSIERTDMSECDQTKGYVVYDDDNHVDQHMGKVRFIEYPKCRSMIDLRGNSQELLKAVEKLPTKGVKGAVVRITFVGTHKELTDYSAMLDDLQKQIRNKILPVHMYSEQKVTDDAEEKAASQVEEDLIDKGHLNEELVLKVVEEMIAEKEDDPEEQKVLISIAHDIYKETME